MVSAGVAVPTNKFSRRISGAGLCCLVKAHLDLIMLTVLATITGVWRLTHRSFIILTFV